MSQGTSRMLPSKGSAFGKPTLVLWLWKEEESPAGSGLAVLSAALRAGLCRSKGQPLLGGHFRDRH